ncbi:MAG: peptidylprolyl isomerase [Clostridiales bacterium]|nr:peptidylprolyl isomerase [Clostridiales bacterium]
MKSIAKLRLISILLFLSVVFAMLPACMTLGERKPVATLLFSNGNEIQIRLYYNKAPNTVKNFIDLANSGFYDGTPVHRIEEYFIIQMGKSADSPDSSNAGFTIKGEFPNNKYGKNDLPLERGAVAMARVVGTAGEEKDYYNSASTQFFIMLTNKPNLDGDYAVFGKVIRGMDFVDKISKMDVDQNKEPRDEIYVVSIRVDTFGKDYGKPDRIPANDES